MLADNFGYTLSTANAVILWSNVVANIYHLIIISLTDKSQIEILLGKHPDAIQILIVIQTVLLICAMMISTIQKKSRLFLSIKHLFFNLILMLIFVDMGITYFTVADLLSHKSNLNKFWNITTHSEEAVAPNKLYSIIAILLATYLVFKFYVAYAILNIAKKYHTAIHNMAYFLSQDVERNTPREQIVSPELSPPSYNQCVRPTLPEDADTPPPPYNDVSKY